MAAARLHVSVASPDSGTLSTRGLGPWLARWAPASARGDVSIAVVSDRRMRALNRQFRGQDAATDVLSFPATHVPGVSSFLGDIVIAAGVAARQAREAGHPVSTELRVLALHGLLHLLGYDHDTDGGKMARAEARLRKKAGLREGLIERTR
ncbi:MAG: Endoribonuclease YbeY [Acidobacteriota bacterium]